MKKFVAIFILSVLSFFVLVPSALAEIWSCSCKDAATEIYYAGFCVKTKEECQTKCSESFPGKKAVVNQCDNSCVIIEIEGAGANEKLAGCYTCNQIKPTPVSCTEVLSTGEVEEEKKFADTPEVVLEIPFGKEGTAASPVVGLSGYVSILYEYIVILVALAAVVMIMFGGFRWATAAGNASQVGAAKTTIINAIIGLVLALTSFLLLYTINPALVSLDTFKIPYVSLGGGEGCPAVVKMMNEGKILVSHPNDIEILKGETSKRSGNAFWCYGSSNGTCKNSPADNSEPVVLHDQLCNVIIAAATALDARGKQTRVTSIIGNHSKCSGDANCAGPAPNCTACLGPPNESPHWSGRGLDIGYGNLETDDIIAMNQAVCKAMGGNLSQIISRPSKSASGALWGESGCAGGSGVSNHHDHTHFTLKK